MGYIRQDSTIETVFFLDSGSTNEKVIYDFNLTQSLMYEGHSYYDDTSYAVSWDYFESGGVYYSRINIENYYVYLGPTHYVSAWIEGFGSTLGLFTPYGGMISSQLLCFSTNGVTIYPTYSNGTCMYIPVGMDNVNTIEIEVYPNPSTSSFILKLDNENKTYSATIFDLTGREVQPLFNNDVHTTFNINIGGLADGLYVIRVWDDKGEKGNFKLVKQ